MTTKEIAERLEIIAKRSETQINIAPTLSDVEELYEAAQIIRKVENKELVEVVHGDWINIGLENSTGQIFQCGNCGHDYNPEKKAVSLGRIPLQPKFCPNCGTKMDGKRKENNL